MQKFAQMLSNQVTTNQIPSLKLTNFHFLPLKVRTQIPQKRKGSSSNHQFQGRPFRAHPAMTFLHQGFVRSSRRTNVCKGNKNELLLRDVCVYVGKRCPDVMEKTWWNRSAKDVCHFDYRLLPSTSNGYSGQSLVTKPLFPPNVNGT